jgi:hypothetical protein
MDGQKVILSTPVWCHHHLESTKVKEQKLCIILTQGSLDTAPHLLAAIHQRLW